MTNSQPDSSGSGEIRFGSDILPLFMLVALFIVLLSIKLALVHFGALASELGVLDTLTATVGTLCGLYISYIVTRVVVLTQRAKNGK
jgi:hypothetical protein